ncbi:MAG: single-stranded DNA-binding protein [Myxococcales bacterium]|nr:single-stranded DNA-binding protein [Myxococcales bacterium]
MSEGLNRVMLLGNLGQDPELRYTQGGQAVLNLRLATTETYFDRDRNKKERTDWHTIVVWGKRAEALSKFLRKGSSLFVEGSIRTGSYEGRDGQKRYKTEISARNIILTGGGGGGRRDDAPPLDYPEAQGEGFDGGFDGGYSGGGGSGGGGGGYGGGGGSPSPGPDFGPDDDDIPF